jgi:flagellar hook-associated protein 1 FlgK
MPDPVLGSGLSGLAAAQLGLATASHNIANAGTPGYSRQEAIQSTLPPQFTGSGFVGRGTTVAAIRRGYDQLLEAQARANEADRSHTEAYANALRAVANLLGDPEAGLSPAVDEFFRGVNEVAARPGDSAARESLLGAANALAARFRALDGLLGAARLDVNRRVESAVAAINGAATQIADLNRRIVAARGVGAQAAEPNDLLDQRDALVRELNRHLRATVVAQDDGSYNVFLGNGQPLVLRDGANRLAAVPDLEYPGDLQVALQTAAGVLRFRPADLSGGAIGGLLAFRNETLDATQNALGRIALALAGAFNDQHRLGQDRGGALGGEFFAAGAPQSWPSAANTGAAALVATIADPGQLSTSDYRVRWDGASWQVTRLADGAVQSFATLPQTVDGVNLAVAGAPDPGDAFLVQPTRAGARDLTVLVTDTGRIAAAAPIRTAAAVANLGSGTISAGAVVGPPPDPNLQQPVTITFTGPGTFDVSGTGTGNPTGVAYLPGAPITYNGWTVTIRGEPRAGDVFTVTANTAGIGDNRNARALADLRVAQVLAGGSSTLEGGYAQLVAGVGNKMREVEFVGAAQAKLLEQTIAAREAVSGVNLDEEAASLLRFQQAYQAAARVIALSGRLFESILEIGR